MKWMPHYTGIETLEIPLLPGRRADLYLSRQRAGKRLDLVRLSVRPWRYSKMVGLIRQYHGTALFLIARNRWELEWLAEPARRPRVEWEPYRNPSCTLTWWRLALTTPIARWVADWRKRVDGEKLDAMAEGYDDFLRAQGIDPEAEAEAYASYIDPRANA